MFNRFPSLRQLIATSKESLFRFPLTIVSAVLFTVVAISLVESQTEPEGGHAKLLAACFLGLPLFTSLTLLSERQRYGRGLHWALQAAAAVFLVVYGLTLPDSFPVPYMHAVRFALLAILFHFVAAFLPYLRNYHEDGFWHFNETLFVEFITSAFYSAVLFIGLSVALLSIKHLFDADIDEEWFVELWFFIAFTVNTWIFLSKIPRELTQFDTPGVYPGGLRILAQFVLLPLIIVYLCILYAYELKILVTGDWPRGWVSHLVLWFSVVGILSLLLLWPLREQSASRWIQRFSKWFFRSLIPLLVMLFIAIFIRISDYGITVNRYLVLAMAVGLTVVVGYFVFSRRRQLRMIPIVVAATALFAAYMPYFNAISVSERSQTGRLERFMTTYGIPLTEENRQKIDTIPGATRAEMTSIVSYLHEAHGAGAFASLLSDSTLQRIEDTFPKTEMLAAALGFEHSWQRYGESPDWFTISAKSKDMTEIRGYDYFFRFYAAKPDNLEDTIVLPNGGTIVARLDTLENALRFVSQSQTLSVDLSTRLAELYTAGHDLETDTLTFIEAISEFGVKVIVRRMGGRVSDSAPVVGDVTADVLLRLRE